MPATLPPMRAPSVVILRTTTAYSEESKRLHDLQADIRKNAEVTASWQGDFAAPVERGIFAEADLSEARTLDDLAEDRRRFLRSVQMTPADADLPAVLLSEG